MNFSKYTIKNTREVFDDLKTSKRGLSEKESRKRLKDYGFNEVKTKEVGLFDVFLRQFKSPFVYLLFIDLPAEIAKPLKAELPFLGNPLL